MYRYTRQTAVLNTYGTQRQSPNRQMTSSEAVYPLPADINTAAQNYKDGDKQAVHRLLIVVASHHPRRIREFLWNASRAAGSLYCRHGDNAPAPLPQIKSLSERREAARAYAGLCGVHNSGSIAGDQLEEVLARGGGPTGTKFRNQVDDGASLGLWNNCLPS